MLYGYHCPSQLTDSTPTSLLSTLFPPLLPFFHHLFFSLSSIPDPIMPQLNKRNFRHSQTSQNAHGNSSTIPHQTCSVPTTPMRSSRDRKRRIQSPSPGQKQQSPQSVVSDGPDSRSLLSRSRNSCPFESTACLGRRRIPYNIGDDPLPRLQDVKESLSPAEERGLASAADLMYKKLLPSPESEDRRRQFSSKLRRLLDAKWPGYRFDVHVFGSSGNLLCTSDSDGTLVLFFSVSLFFSLCSTSI